MSSASDVISEVEALVTAGHDGRAMALLSAIIERDPQPELLILRAQLTMAAAANAPGEGIREQLEWFSSPAGQQSVAIGLERALADVDAALAQRESVEWRLLRGDLLLDGGRFDEAAEAFTCALANAPALAAPAAEEAVARAQLGLELARRGHEGAAEVLEAWQDAAALLSEHDADANLLSQVTEARNVMAEIDERAARELADLDPVRERARRIAANLAQVHADAPERYAPFDPRELDRRARKFYDRALKALEREGFALCADVEPLRNTEQSGTRTMLRLVLSPDRLTVAAVWRLEAARGACEAIELETALADGGFLRTNNLGTTNPFEQPPQLVQLSLPADTDVATLVALHGQRVAGASAPALDMPDLSAIVAGQERQRVLKREFARSRGWISDAELRGLLGASYDELAAGVRAELEQLLD